MKENTEDSRKTLNELIEQYASQIKMDRLDIGLYSPLRITLACIDEKQDKEVFRILTDNKYTFSKQNTKIEGIYSYSVDVDSIEDAYELKVKLVKVYMKHETKCDGCGDMYEEPNPVREFGQFNTCSNCKNKEFE